MKANKKALLLAMARACVGRKEISEKAGMPEMTVKNVLDGRSVRPATLGNELDNVRYQLEGCANALDIMGDAGL